jgi:5-methylcytosine-specific restriction endonuclease McrBC regulatory subunit McrC
MPITTDNNNGKCQVKDDEFAALNKLANCRVDKLCEENLGLLLFPLDFNQHKDGLDEQHIFDLSVDGTLTTYNIMGMVESDGVQLQISSRFEDIGGNDFFLHHMLQKVLKINVFDFNINAGSDSFYDFLIYLFPSYLKRALRQGVYKKYQRQSYNDANIKGPIDFARHIKSNIPFVGKVAYGTRDQVFDNEITQLVRHTIEFIRGHKFAKGVVAGNRDIDDGVRKVTEVTSSYNYSDRDKIIHRNRRSVNHPYFTAYRPLQSLCLQILTRKKLSFGNGDNDIKGVLFDGAWLWEEYLNTLIGTENGGTFKHPRNKASDGSGEQLFQGFINDEKLRKQGLIYPDFIDKNNHIVSDAKYKPIDNISGRDYLQVLAYMYRFESVQGYYWYPEKDETQKLELKLLETSRTQTVTLTKHGLQIPQGMDDWKNFCIAMEENEKKFISNIKA